MSPHRDPGRDPVIRSLLDEVGTLTVPGRAIQMMGAMVIHAHRQMVAACGRAGMTAPSLPQCHRELEEEALADLQLLRDCFAVVRAMETTPRDHDQVYRAVIHATATWGASAMLTFSYVYLRFARTIEQVDPDATVDQLLRQWSLDEEADLMSQGDGGSVG